MNEKSREAIYRLMSAQGVDVCHVEDSPVEIEPFGEVFLIHFRGLLTVTPEEFAAAMQEPTVSDHTEGSTT